MSDEADQFWQYHSVDNVPFSDAFKDLITKMFQFEPKSRLSIPDILCHPWMKGDIANDKTVEKEFKDRFKKTEEARKKKAKATATVKKRDQKAGTKRSSSVDGEQCEVKLEKYVEDRH